MFTFPQRSQQTPKNSISLTEHYQIVIVGGGAAGITTAAQLLKQNSQLNIAIIEPGEKHYYQPGWTLVGGGIAPIDKFIRQEKDVIPQGAKWIKDYVTTFDPEGNTLTVAQGQQIEYDYLVVCPGIQIDWHLVKGLKFALGKGGVTSNYSKDYAPYTWETIKNFQGGTAIFTYPNTPIKCGGAPQKVMYMADDSFKSKSGVGVNTKVMFCSAGAKMFGVPAYNATLEGVIERRGITTKFSHNLKEIKADTKEAIFDVTTDRGVEEVSIHYDMIHVAPPMSSPDFIKQSPLANDKGWVDVNKYTLQHNRYPNVFGLGDASSLPISKTAAAARKQTPVVVQNLISQMNNKQLSSQYDGYTCCPLITGYHSAIMAEFNYEGNPAPSFPLDPSKERYSMFLAKVYALPWIYWNRMLKGEWFEADIFKPINQLLQNNGDKNPISKARDRSSTC
ncbi:FAD-dependent oxidoreductase [Hyella patelloides LEGE 07179]|uniref:FAD-dependent oxidoreductase n=1 Tax=Hyella patelloides LEGE 07179 TaxID=945734 RepID=A0A563VUH8_9CYAN|nr:FAD/NAD(P)-binding oxidoreductase [Hyella patelloides]VEP15044.1 FAD-dependent oxidoreductase [Hyella patelloides LEGE 07179]